MNDTTNFVNHAAQYAASCTNDTTYTSILDIFERSGSWNTLIVIALLVLLCVFSYIRRRKIKEISYTKVFVFTGFVFIAGVVIYTVGALQSERMGFWDAVYTIPSAIISSLGMFVYQDDISELSDKAKHCSEFMAAYSVVHLFAAVITSLIMIKWLGMLVYYKCRLLVLSRKPSDLYVFWGINPQSLALAQSIKEKDFRDTNIVFVNTIDDGEESSVSIHRLLDIIKLKSDVDKQITEMGATVTNCYVSMDDSPFNDIKLGLEDFLRRYAKLTQLSKMVGHAKSLHIFFLSSDEAKNINVMGNITSIAEKDETDRLTHLYCHARRSALTQVFENKDLLSDKKDLHLHIIDSAQLSIQGLRSNVKDCPVNFVDIDKENAAVCSPFNSMIIGFGETGEEAFNFLYEFGAFVDEKGKKTPFRCTIIDIQATSLRENLESKAPALREENTKGIDCLNFVDAEMGGKGFWPTVEKEIRNGVCYIVLSINDDNACLNTAVEICSRAMRWRAADAKPLNVYVRCYNPQNYAQMQSVAQDMGKHYEGISLKIIGGINDIFSYETIVDEKYLKEAKEYNWEYSKHKHEDIEVDWNDGIKIQRTKDDPTIGNIEDSIRRIQQNISNALHKDTKIYILSRAGYTPVYWAEKDLKHAPHKTHYKHLTDKEERVLHNIARLEHERWMASMKLQGWRPTIHSTDDRDVRQKLHEDMRPWDELRSEGEQRQEVQSYDCDVVDTSIRLKIIDNHLS